MRRWRVLAVLPLAAAARRPAVSGRFMARRQHIARRRRRPGRGGHHRADERGWPSSSATICYRPCARPAPPSPTAIVSRSMSRLDTRTSRSRILRLAPDRRADRAGQWRASPSRSSLGGKTIYQRPDILATSPMTRSASPSPICRRGPTPWSAAPHEVALDIRTRLAAHFASALDDD